MKEVRPVDGVTGPVRLSPEICDKWERMIAKYGVYGVAQKMVKTPGWRAYVQRWPFDYIQTRESTIGSDEAFETLADYGPDIVEQVDMRIKRERFIDSLSERQYKIWELYEQGKNPAEIKEILGYNTTNAIRWHKNQIKTKWVIVRDEQ